MRKCLIFFFWVVLSSTGQGYDLSRVEYFLSQNNMPAAKQALAEQYVHISSKQEKEELELLAAQLFLREKNYEQAADIYRKLLVENPSLVRVRIGLGYAYFLLKADDKARYNLRLALADKNLSATTRQQILNVLELIRRRKSWGIYVSLGIVPDSNINMVSGRRLSCFNFMGTPICQELDDAESDVGFQGFASVEYIYKFSDSWGLRSRLAVDAIDYRDKQYSFWGLGGSLGPRYVTDHAEYSVGVSYRQQWNEESRYYHAPGVYAQSTADLSRKLSIYGKLSYNKVNYDPVLYRSYDSDNYGGYVRLIYNLNSHSYVSLNTGLFYEKSGYKWNSAFRQTYGLGYGRELPWGFVMYAEPNISFNNYQDKRYFANGMGGFEEWKRHDTTYGIYISLSSKLLRIYNITPTLNYMYHKRTSNVYNYDYERSRWEIGISRSF